MTANVAHPNYVVKTSIPELLSQPLIIDKQENEYQKIGSNTPFST